VIRRAYLTALLALACGSAVDAPELREAEPAVVDPVVEPAKTAPITTPEPTPAVEPEPITTPEPAPLLPRGCVTADDCLLRASVCRPLEVGGDPVCRRALAPEGAECADENACEVGLVCAWAGIKNSDARVCAPQCYSSTDYACERATRRPLSCEPGRKVLDVDCEVEP
jgi:hypothetical protein